MSSFPSAVNWAAYCDVLCGVAMAKKRSYGGELDHILELWEINRLMLFKGQLIYPIDLGHYITSFLFVYLFRLFMGVNKHGVHQEKFYPQAHDTPRLECYIISPHL